MIYFASVNVLQEEYNLNILNFDVYQWEIKFIIIALTSNSNFIKNEIRIIYAISRHVICK